MTTRPAGGGNSGGFSPHNDMKTDETQTLRVTNATGGTFTLTFNGQTTAPIAYNATAAQIQAALEALSNIAPGDIIVTGNADQHGATRPSTSRRLRADRTSRRSRPTAPA